VAIEEGERSDGGLETVEGRGGKMGLVRRGAEYVGAWAEVELELRLGLMRMRCWGKDAFCLA